jgi:hypothetical protein
VGLNGFSSQETLTAPAEVPALDASSTSGDLQVQSKSLSQSAQLSEALARSPEAKNARL